jgi:hypothetical protein
MSWFTVKKKVVTFLSLFCVFNSHAMETDQYMTWNLELQDSNQVISEFIDKNIKKSLELVNKKHPTSCQTVAKKVLEWNGGATDYLTQVEKFSYESDRVDRYPKINTTTYGVIGESIYANVDYFKLKIFGVNVQVNGVYFGIDKLGHFLTVGFTYYKQYLRAIESGHEESVAIKKALRKGVFTEKTYYGDIVSGVFSYADLEANYQGLRFALDLCDGPNPILEQDEKGEWTYRGNFDVSTYVNPNWDESYNPSSYIPKRWNQVEPMMKKYCDKQNGEIIKKRFQYYQSFQLENDSTTFLDSLMHNGEIRSPFKYSLKYICQN